MSELASPMAGDGTRCVHAGLPPAEPGQPLMPGPVFAAPYHLAASVDEHAGRDVYGRSDNETWRRLEEAIGSLEGGETVAFASGMGAVSAALLALVEPGDVVVMPSDGYYYARFFAERQLATRQVAVRLVPTTDEKPDLDGARLVLLESPSNPALDVCDLAALCAAAHRHGALVAVDNTTATPLGQRPLDLGADLVVASASKALTGHSDLLLGYVSGRDSSLVDRIRTWRTSTGGIPGPFEAWLAHRSLATLDLRLARQTTNAGALAELLAGRPEVVGLRWPGRPDDPAYPVAARQMRRMPGVLAFQFPSEEHVARFLAASRLVSAATSFGGLHTTADRRARWGDLVPAGFVRLSCGCEDAADLLADVTAALDAALTG